MYETDNNKMINNMVCKSWKLETDDSGKYSVKLKLKKVENQFGGNHGIEKRFRDDIMSANAYYVNDSEPYIYTRYADADKTLQSIKEIVHIVHLLNIWINDEGYLREMDKDNLRKKLAIKLYPISEEE